MIAITREIEAIGGGGTRENGGTTLLAETGGIEKGPGTARQIDGTIGFGIDQEVEIGGTETTAGGMTIEVDERMRGGIGIARTREMRSKSSEIRRHRLGSKGLSPLIGHR